MPLSIIYHWYEGGQWWWW